ncbi:MAG: RdgB/HAM1 family non-canonical purine NTP pyrophosphatase [Deltaproteobacteria bacterium]|nr:RdgB/HAM1 family non-canonical purine NTP pyrophosphatase [Deltaproteobacteria bacterium]
MKLLIATGNSGKLREFQELLGGLLEGGKHELVSLKDVGIDAPEEPHETFHENAAEKARHAAQKSGLWALADDSGICVDALNGGPGVRSARFADTDEARRQKLLQHLSSFPMSRRGAHFFCAAALSSPDGQKLFRTEGRVDGRIATAARGDGGFGYDPLFIPAEIGTKTLAELPQEEKNRLSHRGRALARMSPLLMKLLHEGKLD